MKKWQHRRCVTRKDTADYRRIKQCNIFKCANCTLQNIENVLHSEAGATNFIPSENTVGREETIMEKVNSSPSLRPSILSNMDPGSSQTVDDLQIEPSGSSSSETGEEKSNMDSEPAAYQLLSNKFQIVEGGSTKKSNILIDGSGLNFSYGVKRKNQAGVTWRCNFRELKGEEILSVFIIDNFKRDIDEANTWNLEPFDSYQVIKTHPDASAQNMLQEMMVKILRHLRQLYIQRPEKRFKAST
ncbi:hypothetical protein DAPPUDRAFT_320780 [Daphnia pulex]|uniref:FLYWCH-type domain-containing protein n=1 Tax=Daphnia pulex TaxID=6669 RepID=E9GR27_DAPPU|nr:hypothetical protein DAPPUDRAFT_320780 [Daphnia pulex]|eukprot:EFX78066.1 hypothetical protein DAPPUDRAFT_320780 [Daphnia pulex]